MNFKFEDASAMFTARKILNVAFHFLENRYTTKTVTTTLDHDKNIFMVTVLVDFQYSDEIDKLSECIELMNDLDLFQREQEEEK